MTVSNMVSSPGVPDWWTIYTDQDAETYDPHDPRALFHEAIMALESHWDPFIGHARDWEDQLVVDVDLAGICGTLDPGHDFHDLLRDGPEQCLLLLAAAIHQTRGISPCHRRPLCLRPTTLPSTVPALDRPPTPSLIGSMVAVQGTVVAATPIHPVATSLEFRCRKCNSRTRLLQLETGVRQRPEHCASRACRARSMDPVASSAQAVLWRSVWVKPEGSDTAELGLPGQAIQVHLVGELAEVGCLGRRIHVSGIVRPGHGGAADAEDASSRLRPYLSALNVRTLGSAWCELPQLDDERLVELGKVLDQQGLDAVASSLEPKQQLPAVLCKAVTLLALVSGAPALLASPAPAPDTPPIQHSKPLSLLIVTDAGMGVSSLIEAASAAACSSQHLDCGPHTVLGPHAFPGGKGIGAVAGGAAASEPGLVCLEAVERLPARQLQVLLGLVSGSAVGGAPPAQGPPTCILATTTPPGGKYDASRSLMDNVRLPAALLARFDLVLTLLDRPQDPATLALRACLGQEEGSQGRGTGGAAAPPPAWCPGGATFRCQGTATSQRQYDVGASQRRYDAAASQASSAVGASPTPGQAITQWHLGGPAVPEASSPRLTAGEVAALARHLAGCRALPSWTGESGAAAKACFLQLQAEVRGAPDLAPMGWHHLHLLLRLGGAVAAACLAGRVAPSHVEAAGDLLFASLCCGTVCGAPGAFDAGAGAQDPGSTAGPQHDPRPGTKRPSFQARRQRFMAALHRHCVATGCLELQIAELEGIAARARVQEPEFHGFIERLNDGGDILKKGPGLYSYNGPLAV
ncbi:hypothetical protein ACKKBF_B15130 [Auxenochlorella protothecoides x Auxenochlorella symbiontica]